MKLWKFGDPIPETRCPRCSSMIVYDGHYFCDECPWSGSRGPGLDEAEKVAYVQLMKLMGREDEIDVGVL